MRYCARNTVLNRRRLWKPLAYAKVTSQGGDVAAVQRARRDALRRFVRELRNRIERRSPWRELRPAPQARPKPRSLGRRSGIEEAPMAIVGEPRPADRPAIHMRCRDPDEEDAVEPWVARVYGELVGIPMDGTHSRDHDRKPIAGSPVSPRTAPGRSCHAARPAPRSRRPR